MIDGKLGALQTGFHPAVNELLPQIREELSLVFTDGAFNPHYTFCILYTSL
jgi:hypothetical protein